MLLYLHGSYYFPDNIDNSNRLTGDEMGILSKMGYWPAAHWHSVTCIKFHRGSTNISMSISNSQIISNTPSSFLGQNANCPSWLQLAPKASTEAVAAHGGVLVHFSWLPVIWFVLIPDWELRHSVFTWAKELCTVHFSMIPSACLWKRPREQSRMLWKCNGLMQSPLSMYPCFPAAGPSHHRAEPSQQQSSPSSAALWNTGRAELAAGMESAAFICSRCTSLHSRCHGYKNSAITLFRISYFYCNYTTGNYLAIFPFMSPTVYLCYGASSACTEPPSTDLLLVLLLLLPAMDVGADGAGLRGLSSAGQAAGALGQEPTQLWWSLALQELPVQN